MRSLNLCQGSGSSVGRQPTSSEGASGSGVPFFTLPGAQEKAQQDLLSRCVFSPYFFSISSLFFCLLLLSPAIGWRFPIARACPLAGRTPCTRTFHRSWTPCQTPSLVCLFACLVLLPLCCVQRRQGHKKKGSTRLLPFPHVAELVDDIFKADLVWTNTDIKDFSVVPFLSSLLLALNRARTRTHTHTQHTHTDTLTHTDTHTHRYTHAHANTHTYTHIYTRTHTHMHTLPYSCSTQ